MYDYRGSQYFQGLPQLLKESIVQSGVQFSSEDELKSYVSLQNMQL